jgi:hypothetical protein
MSLFFLSEPSVTQRFCPLYLLFLYARRLLIWSLAQILSHTHNQQTPLIGRARYTWFDTSFVDGLRTVLH